MKISDKDKIAVLERAIRLYVSETLKVMGDFHIFRYFHGLILQKSTDAYEIAKELNKVWNNSKHKGIKEKTTEVENYEHSKKRKDGNFRENS